MSVSRLMCQRIHARMHWYSVYASCIKTMCIIGRVALQRFVRLNAVYSASSATSGETRRSGGSAMRAHTANKLFIADTLAAYSLPEFYTDVLQEYLSALGKSLLELMIIECRGADST